jgi:hypothetical protein
VTGGTRRSARVSAWTARLACDRKKRARSDALHRRRTFIHNDLILTSTALFAALPASRRGDRNVAGRQVRQRRTQPPDSAPETDAPRSGRGSPPSTVRHPCRGAWFFERGNRWFPLAPPPAIYQPSGLKTAQTKLLDPSTLSRYPQTFPWPRISHERHPQFSPLANL